MAGDLMADRFHSLIRKGIDSIRAFAKRSAVYSVGIQTVTLYVVVADTSNELLSQEDLQTEARYRDFLILSTELVIGGQQITPAAGHKFTLDGEVFEVVSLGPEACYRKSDDDGYQLRVHTQQVC